MRGVKLLVTIIVVSSVIMAALVGSFDESDTNKGQSRDGELFTMIDSGILAIRVDSQEYFSLAKRVYIN